MAYQPRRAEWEAMWANRGRPTHRLYVAPWCGHCRNTMQKLVARGTRPDINLHIFVHSEKPAEFNEGVELFPDRGYNAVPALYDSAHNALQTSVDSLLGDRPQYATATQSGVPNNLGTRLAFKANEVSRFTQRLKEDPWAQRAAVLIVATLILRQMGF